MKLIFFIRYVESWDSYMHFCRGFSDSDDESNVSFFLSEYNLEGLDKDIMILMNSKNEYRDDEESFNNCIATESWIGEIRGDVVEIFFAFEGFSFKETLIKKDELLFILHCWKDFLIKKELSFSGEVFIDSINRTMYETKESSIFI